MLENEIYRSIKDLYYNNLLTIEELESFEELENMEDIQSFLVNLCSNDSILCDKLYHYVVELDLVKEQNNMLKKKILKKINGLLDSNGFDNENLDDLIKYINKDFDDLYNLKTELKYDEDITTIHHVLDSLECLVEILKIVKEYK
jgi:hypothetical protein